MSNLTARISILLLIFAGGLARCNWADAETSNSPSSKQESLTDFESEVTQCRFDTTSVRSLVKQFQLRYGKSPSVMEIDLDFYDTYDRSVFPEAKEIPHLFFDTLYMPGGATSLELKIVLEDRLQIDRLDIVNQHYNNREALRRSYKKTYKIEGNSIIAHVSYPDLRRARNHQRTLYLNFSDESCEYEVPIILKRAD